MFKYKGFAAAKAAALVAEGFLDLLAPMACLEQYWETMSGELDNMPPRADWATTIPYTLWGDEGTLNFKSWMFLTWTLD